MCADSPEASTSGDPSIPPEQLKKAYQAFKKRLKLARLDDESRLGHGPVQGGRASGIKAIQPPLQYPRAVWDELVRQGKLRNVGHGLFELGSELA